MLGVLRMTIYCRIVEFGMSDGMSSQDRKED